jgi:hypothetical protein
MSSIAVPDSEASGLEGPLKNELNNKYPSRFVLRGPQ